MDKTYVELHDGRKIELNDKEFELLFGYYFHPNPPKQIAPKLREIKCFHVPEQQRSIDEIIAEIKASPAYQKAKNAP